MTPVLRLLLLCALLLPLSLRTAAAQEEEPLYDRLVDTFKKDYLSLGLLVQAVADFPFDPPADGGAGFYLATARLSASGKFDGGFGYKLQTDFTRDLVILDAIASYTFSPAFTFDAGMFKAPFSREELISASSTDFIDRAQMVRALAPSRQIGVGARGRLPGSGLGYGVGVFNGNGRDVGGNDNNQFLYVGRLTFTEPLETGRLQLGANIGYSEDDLPGFQGTRLLAGGDFRLTTGPWLLFAEALYGEFDADLGAQREPWGYQGTLGYMIVPDRHQVLARWDSYTPLEDVDSDFVVLGYNFWPTRVAQVQVNYVIPATDGDFSDQRLLVNFQIAF